MFFFPFNAFNRDRCPPREESESEIAEIRDEIARQSRKSKPIGDWDWLNVGVSLLLATGGIVAAPFSGGLSLAASALGMGWLGIDTIKKITESAEDDLVERDTNELVERLSFLSWCLGLIGGGGQ